MRLDRPALVSNRLINLRERTIQFREEIVLFRFVDHLHLDESPQALQDRDLDVHERKQFFLVESRDQVRISRRRDGRLRRPEVNHLVQIYAEADKDRQDKQEQQERGLQKREPEPLRENRTEHEGEDAHEGEDCEDDPDDAAAQVPAIEPLGGADLLSFGGHIDSTAPHGIRTDICRCSPRINPASRKIKGRRSMRAATSAQEEGDPYPTGIDRSIGHRLSASSPFTVAWREGAPQTTIQGSNKADKNTKPRTTRKTRA